MKKILFVINSLTIGGSEKSLVSLLNLLDYSKYEVDLLMFGRGGEFEKFLPKEVNILEGIGYYNYLADSSYENYTSLLKYRSAKFRTSLSLRLNKLKRNNIQTEQVLYLSQKSVLSEPPKKYDVAIAYSQGMPTYYVAEKVNAKRKIAWINCDYVNTKYDKDIDIKYYEKMEKIIVVSKAIKDSIIQTLPRYKNKILLILDIVNPKLIQEMAKEETELFMEEEFNILTVGRLIMHHKGYDTAVKTALKLKENNFNFKWYVIGEGEDKAEIQKMVKEYGLDHNFILVGKKDNPYPYMKKCSLYVQPSKREGFGLTVIEAKILKKPIVCTAFNTAGELINNNLDGLIVENNENSLFLGIKRLLEDKVLLNKIVTRLNTEIPYSSIEEINKVNKLLEGV